MNEWKSFVPFLTIIYFTKYKSVHYTFRSASIDFSLYLSIPKCLKRKCKVVFMGTWGGLSTPSPKFQKDIVLYTYHPMLEYGCFLWDPHSVCNIRKVQNKFLHFASYALKIPCPSHDYSSGFIVLGLFSLTEWRRTACIIRFIKGLLNGKIDLLSLFCTYVLRYHRYSLEELLYLMFLVPAQIT